MGQVHGEEGHALRFHPARSRSLRLVSPCTRRLAFARSRRGSLLVEEGEAVDEEDEGEEGKKRRRGERREIFSGTGLGPFSTRRSVKG